MTDLVVKSNKLVQALQSLTLSEARLIQLAIIDARETGKGLTPKHPLELNAARYAEAFNVSLDAAYLSLAEAEETLFKRQFTIENDDGSITKSRWIQDANYKKGEGRILLTLTRVLIDQVTKLDGFRIYFTSYHLKQTANFKSIYAVRLYELLKQWKSIKKTPMFPLEKFREQLGVGINEYSRVEAFKRRVVDVAIQQINEFSDITAEYQQHKKGRSVSGFTFIFKYKNENENDDKPKNSREQSPEQLFSKMTDTQRHLFANKLSQLPDMSKYSQGTESFQQFAVRISEMLQDLERFKELYPYLKKVGYAPSNKKDTMNG
ncbi:DNA replication protein [Acinetobacter sp. SFB]|uniref:replication initiation protein RepM n=1 Tax=Acinetobacter sp. SFB TaxID=1805634 RepID=UPI0007D7A68C|nr:replication initiation protein RepM [Acinetobacter sp. SFB]OAL80392.1 DNA replication protein [Acinetobacter sp. SFB]